MVTTVLWRVSAALGITIFMQTSYPKFRWWLASSDPSVVINLPIALSVGTLNGAFINHVASSTEQV